MKYNSSGLILSALTIHQTPLCIKMFLTTHLRKLKELFMNLKRWNCNMNIPP